MLLVSAVLFLVLLPTVGIPVAFHIGRTKGAEEGIQTVLRHPSVRGRAVPNYAHKAA